LFLDFPIEYCRTSRRLCAQPHSPYDGSVKFQLSHTGLFHRIRRRCAACRRQYRFRVRLSHLLTSARRVLVLYYLGLRIKALRLALSRGWATAVHFPPAFSFACFRGQPWPHFSLFHSPLACLPTLDHDPCASICLRRRLTSVEHIAHIDTPTSGRVITCSPSVPRLFPGAFSSLRERSSYLMSPHPSSSLFELTRGLYVCYTFLYSLRRAPIRMCTSC